VAGGDQETGIKHRVIWGLILTAVIGTLIIAGSSGVEANPFVALQDAMTIGALPFMIVMLFMMIALVKALSRDIIRAKQG
jgi:choline-glycine betaine transporter